MAILKGNSFDEHHFQPLSFVHGDVSALPGRVVVPAQKSVIDVGSRSQLLIDRELVYQADYSP
ncbi:MAG: hypothetical protein MK161_15850 [Pirellulales bacterium]|nr:hypothetical protein [Pirellulales bacterium]